MFKPGDRVKRLYRGGMFMILNIDYNKVYTVKSCDNSGTLFLKEFQFSFGARHFIKVDDIIIDKEVEYV